MRRNLGTTLLSLPLALLLTLPAGCGDDGAAGSAAPRSAPGTSSPGTGGPCEDGDADCHPAPILVSGTAGRGEVSRRATELDDDAAVAAYVERFSDSFAAKVTRAVDRAAQRAGDLPGAGLVAAVISVGCDVPPGVDVERARDGGIVMTPHRVPSPKPECFAPVTTVAIAAVS